jgi:ELWxxDGT repeat protein
MKKTLTILCAFAAFQATQAQVTIQRLVDINISSMHCSPTFREYNNALFFDAGFGLNGNIGTEPWVYRQTNDCPYGFYRTSPAFSLSPIFFTTINNKLLFTATDPVNGNKLWTTDGTAAGTTVLKNPSANYNTVLVNCFSSGPAYSNTQFAVLNNKFIFNAKDSIHGEEVFISDATGPGTQLLIDVDTAHFGNGSPVFSSPTDFITVGNKVFFSAQNLKYSYELWVTDGTPAGSKLTKDIYPGNRFQSGYAGPSYFTAFNQKLYFSASDSIHGLELWMSDGSTAGTVMVSDINTGIAGSAPDALYAYKGKLYFAATTAANGHELWTTDSATGTTALLKDLTAGGNSLITEYTPYNGKLYFVNNGSELWSTDGTTAATVLVKSGLSSASRLALFGGKLYFESLGDLWVSDGTTAGTLAVVGATGFSPRFDVSGKLLCFGFSATNKFLLCDSNQQISTIAASNVSPYGDIVKFGNAAYFEGTSTSGGLYALYRIGETITNCTPVSSIESVEHIQFTVYPNPTAGRFVLETTAYQGKHMALSNTIGQTVHTQTLSNSQTPIDISHQPSGLYFIHIYEGNKVVGTQKIAIE